MRFWSSKNTEILDVKYMIHPIFNTNPSDLSREYTFYKNMGALAGFALDLRPMIGLKNPRDGRGTGL
jgi:hypothetical protein